MEDMHKESAQSKVKSWLSQTGVDDKIHKDNLESVNEWLFFTFDLNFSMTSTYEKVD
jgi:hypothetical protein